MKVSTLSARTCLDARMGNIGLDQHSLPQGLTANATIEWHGKDREVVTITNTILKDESPDAEHLRGGSKVAMDYVLAVQATRCARAICNHVDLYHPESNGKRSECCRCTCAEFVS